MLHILRFELNYENITQQSLEPSKWTIAYRAHANVLRPQVPGQCHDDTGKNDQFGNL